MENKIFICKNEILNNKITSTSSFLDSCITSQCSTFLLNLT